MKDAAVPPGPKVLLAFGVRGDVQRLQGGQGKAFASEDVVLKPIADEAEAVWIAETHLNTGQHGFRLARPLTDASGAIVVDGWTAWSRLRGEHRLHGGPWSRVLTLCAKFHEALKQMPRPAFMDRREHNFARADWIAWNELSMPLAPGVAPVIDGLRAKLRPIQQRSQIIHADFAGNVLFADDCEPAIIDLSPYWRPASYAMALTVVDAVLWYGGSTDLLGELTQPDECRQMIARALIFRLAIAGLFAIEHPGAFWSAAIARDLASASPLLAYVES